MDDLLPYYERELGIFRQYTREFSERYPKTAGKLSIAGESSEDPHVERMIQSFALLTARVAKRLDSDYPKFTESLLESLYPHYLRPLWLHAEKDQRIEVEHDESLWVGNDRKKTVDHDETVEVKHDQKITVHNNRTERMDHEEKISIGDNRSEDFGQNETIRIGANRTKSVAKNEKGSIGENWSINVAKMKTETIGMAYIQNVGMGRMENVGMGYDLNVGLIMATVVGASQFTKVGKTVSISAGDKIQLICGQSKLVLTPSAIYLEGSDVHIKTGSKVPIDGPSDVLLNSGGAQSAPVGPTGKDE